MPDSYDQRVMDATNEVREKLVGSRTKRSIAISKAAKRHRVDASDVAKHLSSRRRGHWVTGIPQRRREQDTEPQTEYVSGIADRPDGDREGKRS